MDMRGNPGGAADRRTAEDTTPLVVLWARLCAVPARCVFLPSRPDRIVDPMIRALQQLRAWTGMAVLVGIALTYQSTDTDAAVNQWLEQLVGNLMLSIMLCPFVVLAFIAAARPPNRRLYLRRAVRPLLAMLTLLATPLIMVPLSLLEKTEYENLWWFLAALSTLLFFLWLLGFAAYGGFLAVTHAFRTADIHELVPPLLTTAVTWAMVPVELTSGGYPGVPAVLQVMLLLGGPLSVTGIAWLEVRRLRRHYGLTFRGALGR